MILRDIYLEFRIIPHGDMKLLDYHFVIIFLLNQTTMLGIKHTILYVPCLYVTFSFQKKKNGSPCKHCRQSSARQSQQFILSKAR